MAKVLFTLLRSPFEKDEIHSMDTIAGNNEKGILLLEDAVYYATIEQIRNELLLKNYSIFAIKEELEARGYSELTFEGVELIDYKAAIDIIMEKYDKVISL